MTQQGRKPRIFWYDALRVAAIFAVVYSHMYVVAFEELVPTGSFYWFVQILYRVMADFCVPALVMISGTFMLNSRKPLDLKDLYGRKILRLATATVFWVVAYAVVRAYFYDETLGSLFWSEFGRRLVDENYHLWYMYMIIGLYVLLPILRKICESERTQLYFIGVWLALGALPNMLATIWPPVGEMLLLWRDDKMNLSVFAGYAGYMLLGQYMSNHPLSDRNRRRLYLLAVATQLLSVAVIMVTTAQGGGIISDAQQAIQNSDQINNVVYGAAVFAFFQHRFAKPPRNERVRRGVERLAELSFGVYLMHQFFVVAMLYVPGLREVARIFPPVTLMVLALIVFVLATLVTALIARLPFAAYIIGDTGTRRPKKSLPEASDGTGGASA